MIFWSVYFSLGVHEEPLVETGCWARWIFGDTQQDLSYVLIQCKRESGCLLILASDGSVQFYQFQQQLI